MDLAYALQHNLSSHYIRVLLKRGEDPNQKINEQGDTCCTALIRQRRYDLINDFIKHGAQFNQTNAIGESPICIAAKIHDFHLLNLLDYDEVWQEPPPDTTPLFEMEL